MSVSPRRPKGPALNALRAFEAAARLESFAAAAEELSVTPGAISQHIKALEEWTGVPLFQRNAQGVKLSARGRALAPQFVVAFDALGEAVRDLLDARPSREFQIATMPSLAQLWLPEKLRAIRAALPKTRISVTALESPPNLRRELFDLSLFIREPSENEHELVIAPDQIFPVASPEIAEEILEPSDIGVHPLLVDRAWSEDWAHWASAAQIELPNLDQGGRYSLYSLAQEEAKGGAGVLMAHACLVSNALESGELERVSDLEYATGNALVIEVPNREGADSELVEIATILAS